MSRLRVAYEYFQTLHLLILQSLEKHQTNKIRYKTIKL